MATRSDMDLSKCTIVARTVETSATVTLYAAVKDGNADHECQPLGATSDLAIGIVTDLQGGAGAAGTVVSVALLAGGICPVKLGTGGATAGKLAKYVSATALCDAAPAAAATGTAVITLGMFTQTGVTGDVVGLLLARGWITEA